MPMATIATTTLVLLLTLAQVACTAPPPSAIPAAQTAPAPAVPPATLASTPTVTPAPTPGPTATPTAPPAITVVGLFDLTGDTALTSRPYVDAVQRFIDHVNAQGGVRGRKVSLLTFDYGYNVPRLVDTYKRLVERERPVAIVGSGDLDAEALSWMIVQDRLPYLSPSYLGSLAENVAERPYSFLFGTTYSDQTRALLRHVSSGWQPNDRRPAVAFLFADNAFGRSPLSVGRGMAGQLDIKVADEQYLPFATHDATGTMSSIRNKKADFVIVNSSPGALAVALKAAQTLRFPVQFMTLSSGTDEVLRSLAGAAAENLIGATPFAFVADGAPGFAAMKAAYEEAGIDPATLTTRHVQGWLAAQLLVEGIKRAGDRITGETVRAGLESIADFDTGGITGPLTWTKSDHGGNKFVRLYQVRSGQWAALTGFTRVER